MMMRNVAKVMVLAVLLGTAGTVAGQDWGEPASNWEAQLSVIGGHWTGGTIDETRVGGARARADVDGGWLVGVRGGMEQEMFGWEVTLAEAFADMDVQTAALAGAESGSHANMFLANVDLLLFPTGNEIGDGRIRPFFAAGPGLVHIDTDFNHADDTTAFGINAGAGVKFLLGEDGNPVIRIDWRWHFYFGGDAGLDDHFYRQEIVLGIGFRF